MTYNNEEKKELSLLLKDRPLLTILLVSFLVRLFVMWLFPDQNFPDALAYKTIGKEIFSGNIITNNIYIIVI